MVRMLVFMALDRRLASSVPEVSAPFHIGHCARASSGATRASTPAASKRGKLAIFKSLPCITGESKSKLVSLSNSRKNRTLIIFIHHYILFNLRFVQPEACASLQPQGV